MTDSYIEELKRRKMEEMMRRQHMDSMNTEKKQSMSKLLTPNARERLNNIRLTKPQIADQLEDHLMQLYRANQIKTVVTEEQIIKILDLLLPKRDFRITRR